MKPQPISRRLARWLVVLSDPTPLRRALPARRLHAGGIGRLCDAAGAHSVLPAVVAGLKQAVEQHGIARVVGRGDRRDPIRLETALESAQRRLRHLTAMSLVLRRQLAELVVALRERSLPAMTIKGPEFADRLYPQPSCRPFTDLDLLVPRDVMDEMGDVMLHLGYRLESEPAGKYPGAYGEQTWRRDRADRLEGAVEIHWNLVNSPSLRTGVSVRYNDLQQEPPVAGTAGRPTPASLLVIAAVHGAASHRFDRLGLLWDVCQVARGAAGSVDKEWLCDAIDRTGCGPAVAMALHLADAVAGEPACGDLREGVRLSRPGRLDRALLSRAVVLGMPTPLGRARRLWFRQRLKSR